MGEKKNNNLPVVKKCEDGACLVRSLLSQTTLIYFTFISFRIYFAATTTIVVEGK